MDLPALLPYVYLVAGLALLVGAGEALIRGAVGVATKLGVPTLIVALTIVAFGTSAPELVVGINAVLSEAPTLALGNVVGSNIANVLLVIGLPALIAPIACTAPRLGRNLTFMLAVSLMMILMAHTGSLTATTGAVMLLLLAGFLLYSARRSRTAMDQAVDDMDAAHTIEDVGIDTEDLPSYTKAFSFLIGGIIGIVVGADLLVDGSVTIARALGVSEAVIGLTLVAIGTSLPELVTAIAAAMKGHSDVAVGSVIGSNVFNVLGILGVSSMVGTIPVPDSFLQVDFWVMFGASLLLLPTYLLRASVGKVYGGAMLAAYIGYMIYLVQSGAV